MPCLPLRVLVLEDHLFQRSVAVSLLKQLGCREVLSASNGDEALAILAATGPVDVALCDLQMKGMDGVEFIQRAGGSGQLGAIIIGSDLPCDVRRAVGQMGESLGLRMLGEVGKPLQGEALGPMLEACLTVEPAELSPPPLEDVASEALVRRGMLDHQLEAWYQPKFDLRTGATLGVEVLARWNHPVRGVLSPAVFLPTVERCGLMDELLFTQMHEALTLQWNARSQGMPLNMAFNLHASQLSNGQLTSQVKQILAQYQTPGSSVTFELTESGLLEVPAVYLENLTRLRMMGCHLSIDDFGAGFSSLQRLCQLPFNEIKLDAEFVRGLKLEPRCRAVISSTLALGHTLGMSVVVEGIETAEQQHALMELGCTQGQGYWHARPMPGADLLRWLQSHGKKPGQP
ncbi:MULTISPECIES: EAL domain-containing protein [unclassified Pseudomonas]|uniref:EAL domain-containing response regulator n=1 Tax=unclassified Pseudomonas TaxID=196821 RepID=UPI0015A1A57D|nr:MULTISPECIES: EAL domain-containing response regulator [unclassified Pseudomonas]NWC96539.1 EAL domain-containing response regulator [Pseudomonas sp. IPO3779]NWD17298.1 EAL domain-containing response regulator [Pseudomonas sp. IPO3778]